MTWATSVAFVASITQCWCRSRPRVFPGLLQSLKEPTKQASKLVRRCLLELLQKHSCDKMEELIPFQDVYGTLPVKIDYYEIFTLSQTQGMTDTVSVSVSADILVSADISVLPIQKIPYRFRPI